MPEHFDSGRLEAFSDGVFAIAITLLVLEISVPEDAFDDLWRGIADQWPSYIAYATSFWTIAGLWALHHGLFRRLREVTLVLMRLNMLLLFVVAFLPFPTTLVAEALPGKGAETTAVLFYGGTLLAISLAMTGLARYAMRRPDLLVPDVGPDELAVLTARVEPTFGFYGLVLVLALVAPKVAAVGFLVIAVLSVLLPSPRRDPKRRGRARPGE